MRCQSNNRRLMAGVLLVFCLGLVSCATYEPIPLASAPHLAATLKELQKAPVKEPLSMADVTRLVVEYNPDLLAAKDNQSIAAAQVVQASVIPNPQFSGNYAFFISGPAFADAYGLGLTEDIKALIVRTAARSAAEYDAHKVDADLLWQEWQFIGKARLLYVDLVELRKLKSILEESRRLLAARYAHSEQAMRRGDVDLSSVAPDLVAVSDLDKQLSDLDRQEQAKAQELDALLDLDPNARFDMAADIPVLKVDGANVDSVLSKLPDMRPDLMALKLGYQSQEEKLRAAILAQFPALIFGGSYGSDTSRVLSGGPSITLDLPIFDRNQGNIAIERATRQKLHDEFANRLNAAAGEIKAISSANALLQQQLHKSLKTQDAARKVADHATAAFKAGNIDERSYVDLTMVALNQQQQTILLQQSLLEQQVALATLLGVGMPMTKTQSVSGEAP
jgi:outer membrane protein TolC